MQCVQVDISIGTCYEKITTTHGHLPTYVGWEHTTNREMLNHIAALYVYVYVGVITEEAIVKEVGQGVFRKLAPEANMIYAAQLILEELKRAVDKGLRNKAPRADGIVHEFYIHFWDVIKTGLLSIYSSIIRIGYLLPQQILGTTVCVPTCEASRTINDYRSLILLKTDKKSCVGLSASLSMILAYIIYASQYCRVSNARLWMLLLESETSHYFYHTHNENGYDDTSVKILRVLYVNATSRCEVKGFLSDRFPIEYSVRQGCPLSMIMYAIVLNLIDQLGGRLRGTEDNARLQRYAYATISPSLNVSLTVHHELTVH